jgi:hypothetical protein
MSEGKAHQGTMYVDLPSNTSFIAMENTGSRPTRSMDYVLPTHSVESIATLNVDDANSPSYEPMIYLHSSETHQFTIPQWN